VPLNKIKEVLENLSCDVELDGNFIQITHNGNTTAKFKVEDEWIKEIKLYLRTKQFEYDSEYRKLIGPKSVEIILTRVSLGLIRANNIEEFESQKKRKVIIKKCSLQMCLYFFFSPEYEEFFNKRLIRSFQKGYVWSFKDLFYNPFSISFFVPIKTDKFKLLNEAIPSMEACLFKLAVEKESCWDFYSPYKSMPSYRDEIDEQKVLDIPLATYDSTMMKYFKVGVSSQFPSQKFLAFYHILEFNFLSVSDEVLYGRLKSHINSTGFNGTEKQLNKVISIVKKHSDRSDETEMLMRVLMKYIDPDELMEFILDVEEKAAEKIYTKNHEVFGERFQIQTKKDHVIANTAKLIKYIRNSLVHSSDRYNREDCNIPLTESENIVKNYIVLVRFLAEKIIYAKSL
jgi:hypothetical protein